MIVVEVISFVRKADEIDFHAKLRKGTVVAILAVRGRRGSAMSGNANGLGCAEGAEAVHDRAGGVAEMRLAGDSPRESSVIAVLHEQADTPDLQDHELAELQ